MDRQWEASPMLTPDLCSASLKTMLSPVWVFGMSGPAQAQVCGIINVGMCSLVFTWQHVLCRLPGDTARSHHCSVLAFLTPHDSLGLFFLFFFQSTQICFYKLLGQIKKLINIYTFEFQGSESCHILPTQSSTFFFFFLREYDMKSESKYFWKNSYFYSFMLRQYQHR